MFLSARWYRDRDFLRTKEGFFFCVVGPYHPDDRVIGYLKYLPSRTGKWSSGKHRFKRVMETYTIPTLLETFELLKNSHAHYLFFSPVYNITMSGVPHEYIVEHFKGEEKLAELFSRVELDSLQEKAARFVSWLSQLSDVPSRSFGVTGSILLGIHNPFFSDMDITVYGARHGHKVKEALTEVRSSPPKSGYRFLEGERLERWFGNKTQNHPLSLASARLIFRRKWNLGTFDGTLLSVHPVKREEELKERYGDRRFNPTATVTLQAVVADCTDSIFLPSVYGVRQVEVKERIEANIEEVVSYEGLYDSLAEVGEKIEAKGKLEHVLDCRTKREYERVLVGSPEGKGREYIKPIA